MTKQKYNTAQEVADAIQVKKIKRNSVLVMKRQQKAKGNDGYAQLLQQGVDIYDKQTKGLYHCSYYNKNINSLTLCELVDLDESRPELFSHIHKVRYSILMMGQVALVEEYEGMLITPTEFREL